MDQLEELQKLKDQIKWFGDEMRQQCREQSHEILVLTHQLNLLVHAKRLTKAEVHRLREQAEIDVKRAKLQANYLQEDQGDAS